MMLQVKHWVDASIFSSISAEEMKSLFYSSFYASSYYCVQKDSLLDGLFLNQDQERADKLQKLQAEREEKGRLKEEAKAAKERAKEEAKKKKEEEKELKEKERREKKEKEEKEKAEKLRVKEEKRKERQEALE